MKSFFLFVLFNALVLPSFAKLAIPRYLTATDRRVALESLGLTSATKLLSDPYPLGGYSGIEVGLSSEVVGTSEIARLGNKASKQEEISYSVLTLGKGLYHNLDLYVQFSPLQNSEELTNYGGLIRWGFYQAEYLPANVSLIAYANTTSYQNLINTTSLGYDLVVGFSVEDVTLYSGAGFVRSSGIFMGGADGVVAPEGGTTTACIDTNTCCSTPNVCETKQESVNSPHYLVGLNIKFSKAFLAIQLDRYTQAAYSAKLGYRF